MRFNHYTSFDEGLIDISKNMLNRIHRLVDISKDMVKNNIIDTHGRTLNFSFALRKGKVVEMGWANYRKMVCDIPSLGIKYYNPLAHEDSTYRPCLHSEIACLTKLRNKTGVHEFSNFEIVNVRINRTKKLNCVISAPCCNCLKAMNLLSVSKCYFYDGTKWCCLKPF